MFIVLLFLLQVYTINGSEENIQVARLPFVLPLHRQLREGDKIKYVGTANWAVGIQLDLMNTREYPNTPSASWRNVLHIVVKDYRSGDKLTIDSYAYGWLAPKHIPDRVGSDKLFTLEITIQRSQFLITLNNKNYVYPIRQPLVFGTFLRLGTVKSNRGEAKIEYLIIQRKIDTPQVYIPRFQSAEQFSHFEDNSENITRTCNEEGKKGRNVYLQYQVSEKRCIPLEQPPSSGPFLELLPISYTQCPCECSNNPQQFAILRLFEKLKIDAEKKPQIVVFEAWPRQEKIIFIGNGPFTIQFFPPIDSHENCENSERSSSDSFESKRELPTKVEISCYERGGILELSIVLGNHKAITHPAGTIGSVKITGKGEFVFVKK